LIHRLPPYDATKVTANASLDSLHPRFAVEAHLTHLFAATEEASDGGEESGGGTEEGGDAPTRLPVTLTEAASADLTECAAPDATPMPLGDGRTHLGYQDHYLVDGGQARIILPPWSPRQRSKRTSQRSISSGERVSAGSCGRVT